LAVVELERRNVALGIDLPEIVAARGLLVRDVDLFQVELVARFARDDMRRHRAGAGGKVQFHAYLLEG